MYVPVIANVRGAVKHLAVWHHNTVGPSPLCGHNGARPGFDKDGRVDRKAHFAYDPASIDKPWCSRCTSKALQFAEAVTA
jgi:hypothetical protein